MKTKLKRNDAGLTLLEVMIASGILAVGMVLLMGSVLSVASTTALTEQRAVSTTYIASVMEELDGRTLEEVLTYWPPQLGQIGPADRIQILAYDTYGYGIPLPLGGMSTEEPGGDGEPTSTFDVSAYAGMFNSPLQIEVTLQRMDSSGRILTVKSTKFIEVQ
jgi:prepilin-type N-terminal cleavage/methylation domain-containing protein